MQFKVPQFLDIEDKIFGPFTFRQFVYLAGVAGLCFIIFKLLGLWLGAIPILAVAGLSVALIYYRPNNKPFINMVEASFNYFLKSKLYIWKRRKNKTEDKRKIAASQEDEKRAKLGQEARLGNNKLRDLAWSLDVLDLNKEVNF